MNTEAPNRLTSIVLPVLMLIGGVLSLGGGLIPLASRVIIDTTGIPTWSIYLNIVLGILGIVAGILVMMRKRAGLLLGVVVYAVAIIGAILSVISGQVIQGVIPGIVISVLALIVLARSLTSDSQKSMFA